MAQPVSIQQLLDAVADLADVVLGAAGERHPEGVVLQRLNRAIRRWKLLAAEAGDDTDLQIARTTTDPSNVKDIHNWAPQQYIAQPDGFGADPLFGLLRGLDVYPPSGRPVAMMDVDELERNDGFRLADFWTLGGTGTPRFYRVGGNATPGKIIQIFPWADAVYAIDIRYIPQWVDATDPATTTDFFFGGDQWVINDTIVQTLIRDGQGAGAAAQNCIAWNREIEKDLAFALAKQHPPRKLDVRERRRELLGTLRGLR